MTAKVFPRQPVPHTVDPEAVSAWELEWSIGQQLAEVLPNGSLLFMNFVVSSPRATELKPELFEHDKAAIHARTASNPRYAEIDILVLTPQKHLIAVEVKGHPTARVDSNDLFVEYSNQATLKPVFGKLSNAQDALRHHMKLLGQEIGISVEFNKFDFIVVMPHLRDVNLQGLGSRGQNFFWGSHWKKSLSAKLCDIAASTADPNWETVFQHQEKLTVEGRHRMEVRAAADFIDKYGIHDATTLSDWKYAKRIFVRGGPGTGKTVLLKRLAQKRLQENKRVMVVSPLTKLDHHFKETIPSNRGHAIEFKCIRTSEGRTPKLKQPYPEALFIDEGQDISSDWIRDVMNLPIEFIYVNFDPHQTYNKNETKWDDKAIAKLKSDPNVYFLELKTNLRNSRTVAQEVNNHLTTALAIPDHHPTGKFATHECATPRDLYKRFQDVLQEIRNREDPLDPSHMVCLISDSKAQLDPPKPNEPPRRLPFRDQEITQELRLTNDEKRGKIYGNGRILIDTIRRFKGLEQDVVFVFSYKHGEDQDALSIGLSRAKVECHHFVLQASKKLHNKQLEKPEDPTPPAKPPISALGSNPSKKPQFDSHESDGIESKLHKHRIAFEDLRGSRGCLWLKQTEIDDETQNRLATDGIYFEGQNNPAPTRQAGRVYLFAKSPKRAALGKPCWWLKKAS